MRRCLALVLLAACTFSASDGDGRDDSISLGGKADGGFDVTPGELSQVLMIASLYHAEQLEADVGLSHLAAAAIDKLATGPDGHRGSVDDTEFTSLPQLDAVAYVGPIAIQKLLDFAYAEGYVTDEYSKRWHVRGSERYVTASGFELWGGTPAFTIDRNGSTIALYQTGIHSLALSIDGDAFDVPTDDKTTAYQEMHVAVDETNAIHVFYEHWEPGNAFKHLTYANGQWTDLPLIMGNSLQLANSPSGEIYGLVRGDRWMGSQIVTFAELHHFESDDALSTTEQLDLKKRDFAAVGVGADNLPVIAYLHATCDNCSNYDTLNLRRETPTGVDTATVPTELAWSQGIDGIVTAGGPNATVMLSKGWTSFAVTEQAGTFVPKTLATSAQGDGAGWISSAATDAQGRTIACGHPSSTSTFRELMVDGTGATVTKITDRGATAFCSVATDAACGLHLFYGDYRSYLHAAMQ